MDERNDGDIGDMKVLINPRTQTVFPRDLSEQAIEDFISHPGLTITDVTVVLREMAGRLRAKSR